MRSLILYSAGVIGLGSLVAVLTLRSLETEHPNAAPVLLPKQKGSSLAPARVIGTAPSEIPAALPVTGPASRPLGPESRAGSPARIASSSPSQNNSAPSSRMQRTFPSSASVNMAATSSASPSRLSSQTSAPASQFPSFPAVVAPLPTGGQVADWPLSLAQVPEDTQTLTAEQQQDADEVASQFLEEIEKKGQPANEEQAFNEWEAAKDDNDDLLRAKLGWQAFNALSVDAAKTAASGH